MIGNNNFVITYMRVILKFILPYMSVNTNLSFLI